MGTLQRLCKMKAFCLFATIFVFFISFVLSAPQQGPEINDQFDGSNQTTTKSIHHVDKEASNDEINATNQEDLNTKQEVSILVSNKIGAEEDLADLSPVNKTINQSIVVPKYFMARFYTALKSPIVKFFATPKVNLVFKNIGTCIVNGAMELVSFFIPAPLIPIIASAAGMVLPFEPVVMLREKMPVTSYRRAFKTAVNTFLGTFDRFKVDEDDPYMTRRFNRRVMGISKEQDRR